MDRDLIVGLHRDQYGRFDPYLQIYEHILDHNGIKHLRLEASQPDFWKTVATLDLIIFHWVYIDRDQQMAECLIPTIEKDMGIQCFPNWRTFWHYNSKIKQYYLLKNHNLPVIESFIFWDKSEAKKWIDCAQFPAVFKLSRGALSQDVLLVKDKRHALSLTSRMFGRGIKPGRVPGSCNYRNSRSNLYRKVKYEAWILKKKFGKQHIEYWWQKDKNYVFFQEFLAGNSHTTRVTVIGDRAFAFNIKTVKGDFRAYDMQAVDFDPKAIDIECIRIAFRISNTLGFQCMAYDFLFTRENEPKVCEMGYTSYALDIYKCPGYWDSSLSWYEGHFWPQYFQLMDLLPCLQLKQPKIDVSVVNKHT